MHRHITVQAFIPIVIFLVSAISRLSATRSRLLAMLASLRRWLITGFHFLFMTGFHFLLHASNLPQLSVMSALPTHNCHNASTDSAVGLGPFQELFVPVREIQALFGAGVWTQPSAGSFLAMSGFDFSVTAQPLTIVNNDSVAHTAPHTSAIMQAQLSVMSALPTHNCHNASTQSAVGH